MKKNLVDRGTIYIECRSCGKILATVWNTCPEDSIFEEKRIFARCPCGDRSFESKIQFSNSGFMIAPGKAYIGLDWKEKDKITNLVIEDVIYNEIIEVMVSETKKE